jgi:hypothetical protein
MAVCCKNLTLGTLSSRSALSVLVGVLFKNFGLFLNKPCTSLGVVITVITAAIKKRFGLVDKSQMWLKVNKIDSKIKVPNTITSIIHGTSSCGLSVRNI